MVRSDPGDGIANVGYRAINSLRLEKHYLVWGSDITPEQREAYVAANAAALRDLGPADLVFANHVLLGAPVGAATSTERPSSSARQAVSWNSSRPNS